MIINGTKGLAGGSQLSGIAAPRGVLRYLLSGDDESLSFDFVHGVLLKRSRRYLYGCAFHQV